MNYQSNILPSDNFAIFGDYKLEDDYYLEMNSGYLTTEEYITEEQSLYSMKPGGGTGIIPNRTSIGNCIIPILTFCVIYLIYKFKEN